MTIYIYVNFSTTYITCPANCKKTLGIKLPFLVMIIKNMKKYFTFEVQVSTFKYNNIKFTLHFYTRFLMTRMYIDDSVHPIINQLPGSNPLYVPCL